MTNFKIKPMMAVLIILFAFLQYKLWFGHDGLLAMHALKQQVATAQEQIAQERQENQHLTKQVRAIKGDKQTLEGHARNELGMVKKGEILYKVV